MNTKRVLAALLGSGALTFALLGATPAVLATGNSPHEVTLCHATSSEDHPYIKVTVDLASSGNAIGLPKGGHANHGGDGVWYPGAKADGFEWGDIIPPYDFGAPFVYAGLNWADGASILDNGCKVPGEPSEAFIATEVHLGDGVDEGDPVVVDDAHPATDQDKVHDSALLDFPGLEGGLPQNSSVTFHFYDSHDCSGDEADSSSAIDVSGEDGPVSLDPGLVEGPLDAGDYSFRAVFTSGDTEVVGNATGDCEPFTVVEFSESQAPASEAASPSLPNTATLGGNTSGPSDSSWLLVAALGVLLASVMVMTPVRVKARR